jgi:hypothetical protein
VCPDVEEIGVKCPYLQGDRLFVVGICCTSFSSKLFLKVSKEAKIVEPLAANWICGWLRNYDWEVMVYHSYSRNLASLEPVRKIGWQTIGKRRRRRASCHPLAIHINFFYADEHASAPRRDKCSNVNGDCVEVWCVPSATHVPCIHYRVSFFA